MHVSSQGLALGFQFLLLHGWLPQIFRQPNNIFNRSMSATNVKNRALFVCFLCLVPFCVCVSVCVLCPIIFVVWFHWYLSHSWQILFGLILYVPVNKFSVMSGQVFLGWTSSKQQIKCLAQGHNTVTLSMVKLESTTLHPKSNILPTATALPIAGSWRLRWGCAFVKSGKP